MTITTAAVQLRHFTLPLPAGLPLLNANQRTHYAVRARLTATIRSAAMEAVAEDATLMAALAAAKPGPLYTRAHILGILHPPTRRRADPANWYPSFKAAVDGIVDAGVLEDDDHTRVIGPDMRIGTVVKGGRIVLVVRGLEPGEQWPNLQAVAS
ncbi:MAG: Endodeoxyribonuclease RusA [Frankiales bacterium]|nr:Endodeoxyribonuclease RusA [Frankiales bacterium]